MYRLTIMFAAASLLMQTYLLRLNGEILAKIMPFATYLSAWTIRLLPGRENHSDRINNKLDYKLD